MNIFAMMDYGAVVYATNEEYNILVTWRGGSTFHMWTYDGRGQFTEVDLWNYGGQEDISLWPLDKVQAYCEKHIKEIIGDED